MYENWILDGKKSLFLHVSLFHDLMSIILTTDLACFSPHILQKNNEYEVNYRKIQKSTLYLDNLARGICLTGSHTIFLRENVKIFLCSSISKMFKCPSVPLVMLIRQLNHSQNAKLVSSYCKLLFLSLNQNSRKAAATYIHS